MNNIRSLRKARGMSQAALAEETGVAQNTVSQWENGVRDPDNSSLRMLSMALNASIDEILGGTGGKKVIPVLGTVPAGVPLEAVEDILDYEEVSADMAETGELFALRVRGDSMEPRIKEGDVLIVKKQSTAETGDTVIAFVNSDNEATVKRYRRHDDGITLMPNNPAYPHRFFTRQEVADLPVRIVGKVIELRAKF